MVYRTAIPDNSATTIRRHDIRSMGINPIGLDYCRVEDIIAEIGPQLQVPHRHDYYEIIWFTEGIGSHMVEFAHYDLRPNMLFFFPRSQIHAFLTLENIKGHMLRFDESFIKKTPGSDLSCIEYTLFKIHSSPIRYLPREKVATFSSIIHLLKNELESSTKIYHLEMLQALLNTFFIESERIAPAQDTITGTDKGVLKRFYQFTSLLEDNFHKHYSVQQYAEMMHMAPKTLRSICKQISGLSVKAIIQDRVALEAKLYLQNTDLDIQEISYRLGFEDPSYFSRYFKKVTQEAPSVFRMLKGKKAAV